ncbi:Retrotransposon-like protein 1 [Labeo rohita]|uniref:Retrotransposon-like protein 1 n=1 Tax=Labeo rohita TaxID=84645 RepID=A0ABQ8L9R8_LABRO|nr:Retrotransposon-like protein 1 [Labeo rohita]
MDPHTVDPSLNLTSLTEEVVKTLQTLRLPSTETASPPSNPPPQVPAPTQTTASLCLAYPEKFESRITSHGGELHCLCMFSTDRQAFDWATAVWNLHQPTFPSFEDFLRRFREVFDLPKGGDGAGEQQILTLRQQKYSAAEFSLTFRTLTAQTGWPDDPLKLHFRRGLNVELQSELACRDEGKTLDKLTDLTIRIDNLIRHRRLNRSSFYQPLSPPLPDQEAMQVGHSRLSPEERDRLFRKNLRLYWGQPGHTKAPVPRDPSITHLLR